MRKWLPLAPAGTPGVWWDVANMIPTRGGAYYPGYVLATHDSTTPATPGTTLRAWCALVADDTAVRYVGTTTKLYVYDGVSSYTDRSVGGGYTNTATDWSFAQYGNITLASNRVDNIQVRDSTGAVAFAALGGSPPKARILVTQAEQVLLFDLNDGAEKPDAFAASAPGDHTDWSGAGATTATRIRHRPGKVTAAVSFGRNTVIAFKQSSVYRLTYTGGTYKWQVELIAVGKGAFGSHDVVSTGDEIVFCGPGGAWRFDGSSFRPISDWWGELKQASVGSLFAPRSGNVFFVGNTGSAAFAHVYNVYSDMWGYTDFAGSGTAFNGRPMTGDSAALRAVVSPTAALPDLLWLFNLSSGVKKNSAYWGAGSSGSIAYLTTGAEGNGSDVATYFDKLIPTYTHSLGSGVIADARFTGASFTTPANTSLRVDAYFADVMDTLLSNNAPAITISGRASFGAQRRFDIGWEAAYGRFTMILPANAGYTEIADLEVKTGAPTAKAG